MNREMNLDIIKNAYPKNIIKTSFIYDNKEIFCLGYESVNLEPESTAFFVSIDDSGNMELFDYWLSATPELLENEKNTIRYIDISQDTIQGLRGK